jgi:hypothetical protein
MGAPRPDGREGELYPIAHLSAFVTIFGNSGSGVVVRVLCSVMLFTFVRKCLDIRFRIAKYIRAAVGALPGVSVCF